MSHLEMSHTSRASRRTYGRKSVPIMCADAVETPFISGDDERLHCLLSRRLRGQQ